MKIHCYYESLESFPHDRALLELWKETWSRHGWEPVVLSEEHARRHRMHDELCESPWLQHTINQWDYARCCYRRWMAYATEDDPRLITADYDVINYGWRPEDCPAPVGPWGITILDVELVPCLVTGPTTGYEQIVRLFRNASRMKAAGPLCIADDLSDMNLIRDFGGHVLHRGDEVRLYLRPDWEQGRLVHFPNSVTPSPESKPSCACARRTDSYATRHLRHPRLHVSTGCPVHLGGPERGCVAQFLARGLSRR